MHVYVRASNELRTGDKDLGKDIWYTYIVHVGDRSCEWTRCTENAMSGTASFKRGKTTTSSYCSHASLSQTPTSLTDGWLNCSAVTRFVSAMLNLTTVLYHSPLVSQHTFNCGLSEHSAIVFKPPQNSFIDEIRYLAVWCNRSRNYGLSINQSINQSEED